MIALMLLFLSGAEAAIAQGLRSLLRTQNDTSYVRDLTQHLTLRLYGSRKYTYYDMEDKAASTNAFYRPNVNTNVGFGVNYKFIAINIGIKLPFLNNDNDLYGKTKLLDLQSHLYLRKVVADFYGQYYKGYHLAAKRYGISNAISYPDVIQLRPDMRHTDIGLNVQYIFNDEKFSYRAAYLQNEQQLKSAGSFMAGGEVFAWQMRGDSALAPDGVFGNDPFTGSGSVSLAVNGGYAHTFVFFKHFFVTASLSVAAGVNRMNFRYDHGTPAKRGYDWQLNNTVRFAAGYNSRRFFAGVHYVDMISRGGTPFPRTYQNFGTGNLRFSVVHRFTLKKALF